MKKADSIWIHLAIIKSAGPFCVWSVFSQNGLGDLQDQVKDQ